MTYRAIVVIEYIYEGEDYKAMTVLKDTERVLWFEVSEGGVDIVSDFSLDEKVGYYYVDYDYDMESESWETPHIQYPVISDFHITRIGFIKSLFYSVWFRLFPYNYN